MSNSSLVVHKNLSPNNSGKRTAAIDRITPHCVVGQCSAESLGAWFAQKSAKASSNYGIDKDGRVGMYVIEANRAWTTSSSANDNRAVTIEVASDTKDPYRMNDVAYEKLIELCTDICKRNKKTKLIWWPDREKTLSYTPAKNEMVLTVHRWFANKSCPGEWLYSRLPDLAAKVNANLNSGQAETPTPAKPVEDKPFEYKKREMIRLNSRGKDVLYLQKCLNKLGYTLAEDSLFGMKTYAALRNYQASKALDVDGICGPQSWKSINAAVSLTLAKEVIHGMWGNQPDRQRRLEAAGFEYEPIKEQVDILMGKK